MNAFPRWLLMWLLAALVFALCKLLTLRGQAPSSRRRLAGYLLAWPGLDAPTFLRAPRAPVPAPTGREWLFAGTKTLLGLALFLIVPRHLPAQKPYLVGWCGMVGLVFILHFGSFHLLSCAWRRAGVDAPPLMRWPLGATSVSDFWGKRWNRAFRDLTHRFLLRPLAAKFPAPLALCTVFLFSGLVHDLVISVPAGGGYGGPTLFFTIQGAAMLLEHGGAWRKLGLARDGRGRSFAILVLLVPLPLLFHRPFAETIVLPMMHSLGSLP